MVYTGFADEEIFEGSFGELGVRREAFLHPRPKGLEHPLVPPGNGFLQIIIEVRFHHIDAPARLESAEIKFGLRLRCANVKIVKAPIPGDEIKTAISIQVSS